MEQQQQQQHEQQGATGTAPGTHQQHDQQQQQEEEEEGAVGGRGGSAAVSSLLDFMCLIGKLKHLKRTGWVRHKVDQPECIADHMYRMGIMAMLFADSSLDRDRMVKLALVHDMAAIVGDITPHCGVSEEEKFRLEHEGMMKIKTMLAGLPAADEFVALWLEYERRETPEAQVVGQIDKFDMYLQAHEYETSQGLDLSEFFRGAETKVQHPEMQGWLAELLSRRDRQRKMTSAETPEPHSSE